MLKQLLNGTWKLRMTEQDKWIDAKIPGSVLSALLDNKVIEDPFWRMNEYKTRDLFKKNYEYATTFSADDELLSQTRCELVCNGLDTLAIIYLNNQNVAFANNMHRIWHFNIKPYLKKGSNELRIVFLSPIKYLEDAIKSCPEKVDFTATGSIPGNGFLRKAHCMFGWDWGPQLPDLGIWRDIQIEAFSDARLVDVTVHQNHTESGVMLHLSAKTECADSRKYRAVCTITSPDGEMMDSIEFEIAQDGIGNANYLIKTPKLWWPNGYGKQPLYTLMVRLMSENSQSNSRTLKVGLRTLTVSTKKDNWGNEFCFVVNGVKIFAMGANYVPQDSILSRITPQKTETLIQNCVKANFNCLRIWGGGYYPEDDFYDICDRYGILIWQDFMFACNVYNFTEDFEKNVVAEVLDNVRRIKHHACLGLWCGNNEMELGWVEWERVTHHSAKLRADYIKQFEYVLPKIVHKEDPDTFYWSASPSSNGCFDNPNDENRGDVHYWEVWHGLAPFTNYRKYYFRFCSEFGFQAFPTQKTVLSFTDVQDRNIFSPVMESHQKNGSANGRIMFYLSDYFRYPKDFESMIYISQLLQAEAIKYGVEHWRRNRGRCMGATYWQLNDCWPVASWASIDYYGRWKALHYAAKKFYSPILVSALDEGMQISFYAHNEQRKSYEAKLIVCLMDFNFSVLREETRAVYCPALSAVCIDTLDFTNECNCFGKEKVFLSYKLIIEDKTISRGCNLFVVPKKIELKKPHYHIVIAEDEENWLLKIQTDTFAPFVELTLKTYEAVFSDNYFFADNKDGETIIIKKSELPKSLTAELLLKDLAIRSLADSY